MSMKAKKKAFKKKETNTSAKRGGVLPILPILGALGSLIGGVTSVAKAINDRKAAQRQLEKLQHHAIETRGLYLASYKYGRGVTAKKEKKKKKTSNNKNTYGCNYQRTIESAGEAYARIILQSVFMRNALSISGACRKESGIVNLDNTMGPGTH
ncbi:hypothetical protein P5V15_015516 [Pogonomyrmex californicus]